MTDDRLHPDTVELLERRKRHFVPTAYHYHKEPLQLTKAQGCHVWDATGRRYLDAIGGIVSISAGHNHPRIKQMLLAMLDRDEIQHTSVLYLTKYPVELAERLVAEAPPGLTQAAFTNSGSEANEFACMAARHATGDPTILSLQHGYHGGTSGALASCGQSSWRFRGQPVAGVVHAPAPYCYRCPFGATPDACALECARAVETTIQTATHGRLAAMIAEPIMGVGGFITPPKDYFDEITRIVHRYGGKYISDEVQTGAGRCGEDFLLTNTLGIDADAVTMAKGLGNGAAVGAVLVKPDLVKEMAGKLYFNTFAADPYQMAQASANMDIIREERLIGNAKAMGARLTDGLKGLMERHPLIGDVRGRGLLVGCELVQDRRSKAYAPDETAALMEYCKEHGVLIGKGGLFGNVIRLAPPLAVTAAQIDELLTVIDRGLTTLARR
ncbi:MAG: aspartate aminotransferase family protein [Deltaproteobacteria bacterium]|nr:aspartate aminotransferase family protein [Deltaproteobacteria bacterium]